LIGENYSALLTKYFALVLRRIPRPDKVNRTSSAPGNLRINILSLAKKTNLPAAAAVLLTQALPANAEEADSAQTGPRTVFSTPLPDLPSTHLEVVELFYPPKDGPPSTADNYPGSGHHHPGSVYLYVTEGAIRIGVEGQGVSVVEKGGSYFEPPKAHHMFTESASQTESARVIAVMIVPDGESSVVRGKSE
jgi:quercetin dioxygenase-like cupin family protein